MLLLCDQSVLVLSLTDGNINDRVLRGVVHGFLQRRLSCIFDRCSWGPLCHSHAIAPHATSRLCSMQALQFTFGVSLFSLHFVGVESLNSPNFDVFPCFPSKAMKSHTKQTHQANWIFVRCVRKVTKVM